MGAVFAGGFAELLQKGAVKGSWGTEADDIADLGNTFIGITQVSAGGGHAERIDMFIELHMKLTAEKVGNIIFTHMQLLGKDIKRQLAMKVAGAEADDRIERLRVAAHAIHKDHMTEQFGEHGAQQSAKLGGREFILIPIAFFDDLLQQGFQRGVRGNMA